MNSFIQRARLLTIILLLLSLGKSAPLRAQVSTGSIVGSVVDSTEAVVPGATVTATNLATNLAHSATSNSDGLFAIPNLPTGNYQVDVSAKGFSTESATNIALDAMEPATPTRRSLPRTTPTWAAPVATPSTGRDWRTWTCPSSRTIASRAWAKA
jgi:hypothetical protein